MDRNAFYDMTYGVFVLGAMDGARPVGCVVNTVIQLTSEPITVGVSVNHNNYTNECIKKTGLYSVSILSEEIPMETIAAFGFRSGRNTDKFAGVRSRMKQPGVPVLSEKICGTLVCRVVESMELSTHTLFIAEVLDAERAEVPLPPMTYAYYQKVRNGTVPRNAPTYIPPEKKEHYDCSVCGFHYDNRDGAFEMLPAEWTCPRCGMPKNAREKST